MEAPEIKIVTVVSLPFEENSYIVHLDGGGGCFVVDPGLEPDKIIDAMRERGLAPRAILNTHGHSDHIGGNAALKQRWPECPLVIGSGDAAMLTDAHKNLSATFGMPIVSPRADRTLEDGELYDIGGISLETRLIPGHTPGHVVYAYLDRDPGLVFVGDVIFAGSIGRTDFPGGDLKALLDGIRKKLYSLPDETVLLSGHGPPTTVGREKATNPFVRGED